MSFNVGASVYNDRKRGACIDYLMKDDVVLFAETEIQQSYNELKLPSHI